MGMAHDLISCFDDDDLAELLQSRPESTEDVLTRVLGEKAAADATGSLTARFETSEAAGFFHEPDIDPALPEIVLLHGITDCHLANVRIFKNRIWLDYLELIKGSYSGYLTLQEDGISDQPSVNIETDGSVSKKYDRARGRGGRLPFSVTSNAMTGARAFSWPRTDLMRFSTISIRYVAVAR